MSSMNRYPATQYLAGGSKHIEVWVGYIDHQFGVFVSENANAPSMSCEFNSLRVSEKIDGLPIEIALPNGDTISIDESVFKDSWLDEKISSKSLVYRLEKNAKAIIASLLLIPLLLYGLFAHAIPASAIVFADYIPHEWKVIASSQTLVAFDRTVLEDSSLDNEVKERILDAFHPITQQFSNEQVKYTVLFRQSDILGANAFALPDGTVVFTDALIELMQDDESLLGAILLHEIGHVEKNHSMRLIAESIATSLFITYFFGDVSGAFESIAGGAGSILQNQYSQEAEWEADNFALAHSEQVGLNPHSFADAMQRFAEEVHTDSETTDFFSTHPSLYKRIQNAKKQAD